MGIYRKKLSRLVSAFVLVMFSLTFSNAFAACTQGNLTGVWFLTGLQKDRLGPDAQNIRCKLKVDAGGPILASSSSCETRISGFPVGGEFVFDVEGGTLKVNSSCAVSGSFELCGREGEFDACVEYKIESARLNAQKQVITWLGFVPLPDNDSIHHFLAVKQVK
jgi:hypothetical protein